MKRALYAGGAAGLVAGGYLLGSITLGGALAQTTSTPAAPAAEQADSQTQGPAYSGSIKVAQDQPGQTEANEATALASQAKITADQAKAAALGQFPGATVLKVGLENENGNLVYAVALTDSSGTAQDVKVDAGTAKVLQAEAGGGDAPSAASTEAAGAED